jgi:peroxiredoxin
MVRQRRPHRGLGERPVAGTVVVMPLTLLDEDGTAHLIDGTVERVDPAGLTAATGWAIKPEGLCRGSVCVPVVDPALAGDGPVDLARWAAALGYGLAVDVAQPVAALAPAAGGVGALTVGSVAPDLTLPDVDGVPRSLSELTGRKRVLVTWASWCGCRHELGAWRELQNELDDAGLSIFSVALDRSADDVRPWVEAGAPTYPVVIDSAHVTAARYGITNVPSTVWIDESDIVVKPPTISPGDDQFREFTKIDAAAHHDALRRWVIDDELPGQPGIDDVSTRTADELLAIAEWRLGSWLMAAGDASAADEHLRCAAELAPWDWTVRRAGIALRGDDPFLGEEFLAFWQDWDAAGRPGYTTMS